MKKILFYFLGLFMVIMSTSAIAVSQENELCNIALPTVQIKPGTVCTDQNGKKLLDTIARITIDNPGCNLAIISYADGGKRNQQLSWDRVNQVVLYLAEKKGIRYERLIFLYAQEGGDINTLDFRLTQEHGPNMVSPPYSAGSLLKVRSGKCF